MQIMAESIAERFRLGKEAKQKLKEVAKRTNRTKSEVLRAGIEHEWNNLDRLEQRRKAFEGLARMAEEIPGGPKLRFRAK